MNAQHSPANIEPPSEEEHSRMPLWLWRWCHPVQTIGCAYLGWQLNRLEASVDRLLEKLDQEEPP